MKIQLITPAPASAKNGNRITAIRWARLLRKLGHRVVVRERYDGAACDLMVALHAHRSFDSIHDFRKRYPERPMVVVLTGTDLYRDIRTHARARKSLEAATRVIVLQRKALEKLPKRLRRKTRVIYQSAAKVRGRPGRTKNVFKVCVIGHLRPEKDPMRTALAVRSLPPSSRVSLVHIGRPLTPGMRGQVRREVSRNPRYRWLGELPHWKTRRLLAA